MPSPLPSLSFASLPWPSAAGASRLAAADSSCTYVCMYVCMYIYYACVQWMCDVQFVSMLYVCINL